MLTVAKSAVQLAVFLQNPYITVKPAQTWRQSSKTVASSLAGYLKVTQAVQHLILTLCREAVATGDLGLSGVTAVEGGAFLYEHWTCSAVDRSIHWKEENRNIYNI